jgi:hypothetical protein
LLQPLDNVGGITPSFDEIGQIIFVGISRCSPTTLMNNEEHFDNDRLGKSLHLTADAITISVSIVEV